MSKRKKRSRSAAARRKKRLATQQRTAVQQTQTAPVAPKEKGQSRGRQSRQAAAKVDFASEYHYVINDLKRFALTALAMFATLIILALVLR